MQSFLVGTLPLKMPLDPSLGVHNTLAVDGRGCRRINRRAALQGLSSDAFDA